MSLRNASRLLIGGLLYTIFHKAAWLLVPGLSAHRTLAAVGVLGWLAATCAIIAFAAAFIAEVRPPRAMRQSLYAVIVLTVVVMVCRLPLWPNAGSQLMRRATFMSVAFLNSVAMFVFVFILSRALPRESPIAAPVRVLAIALGVTVSLGIVQCGELVQYLTTHESASPLSKLPLLAAGSFAFTHGAALWFLVRLSRLGDYRNLIVRQA